MNRAIRIIAGFTLGLVLGVGGAGAMDPRDLQSLEAAELGADVLVPLIAHQSLETGQVTVAELVRLKKAGLSDATLGRLIEQGSFLRSRSSRIYRAEGALRRFLTVGDLVRLKEAGIEDATLRALVRGDETGPHGADERRRAWHLLETMGLVLDARSEAAP